MHTPTIRTNKLFERLDECLFENGLFFNLKPQAKTPKDMKSYEITLAKILLKQLS